MGLFHTKTATRILLLTREGLTAFTWQGDLPWPDDFFSTDAEGLTAFEAYLAAAPETPLYLVVDCLEEDFRSETIPPVHGRNWRLLIARKLNQFFRATPYRTAIVQGREKSGRRNFMVLFSALTNSELPAPWHEIIMRKQGNLKGIVSAASLMKLFAGFPELGLDQVPHLLLVNVEADNGLRQTYLQNGRLLFSRLIQRGVSGDNNLPTVVESEGLHIRQYLERLRLLPREQPLDTRVFAPDRELSAITAIPPTNKLMPISYNSSSETVAAFGFSPKDKAGASQSMESGAILPCLAKLLRGGKLTNVYAPPSSLRFHRLRLVRKVLYLVSAILLLATLEGIWALTTAGINDLATHRHLVQTTALLEEQYQNRQSELLDIGMPAEALKRTVETVASLERPDFSPVPMLTLLGAALDRHPDIRVRKLEWKLKQPAETSDDSQPAAETSISTLPPAMLTGKTEAAIILEGESLRPGSTHQETYRRITGFINTLKQTPGLKVEPLDLPLEFRPETKASTALDGKDIQSEFSLQISREVKP